MTDPTGAQIVWDCLTREGVTDVFGYPGGAILPIYDAMAAYPVRHVLVRHEQGATHMADGYARASGRVGVALATSGPGATNMVTGLATAKMDSSPVVCITGQVSSHLLGTTAFQEVDITRIAAPVTKESHLVTRPEDIGPTLQRAFAVAREGRPGPVLVDITKDAQQGRCAPHPGAPATPAPARRERRGLTQQDRRALELIARARRPVILAGHGILLGGAERELRQFAEAHDIPVALTLLGLGALPASHPLNLGMMGLHGGVWVNEAIQAADLLIALGMRFDDRVTGDPARYAPTARKIHVDIDPGELNKIIPVDLGIAADVGRVLRRWLRVDIRRRPSGWSRQIADRRAGVQQGDRAVAPSEPLTAIQVIQALSRMTGGQALVATDVGQHQMWEAQHYGHETPRSLITSGGCGTMGFALPAAIGAKLAMPAREVW
ncbi:MAG: thiamine pyrophosphate-binding protein, partial [Vicinamibacterales bacterium]